MERKQSLCSKSFTIQNLNFDRLSYQSKIQNGITSFFGGEKKLADKNSQDKLTSDENLMENAAKPGEKI